MGVDMDDLNEVPFEFTLPRDRVVAFAEGEDDEDASLSDTFGSGGQEGPAYRSAWLDFPAVMTLAAERVGLPLPPPKPPFGRSFTARCFRRSRPSSRPRCQISGSVWRRRGCDH